MMRRMGTMHAKRITALVAALGLVLLSGCGSAEKKAEAAASPPEEKKEEPKPDEPKIAGLEEAQELGATEILVKNPIARSAGDDSYVQNKELPAGTIRGVCMVAFPKGKELKRGEEADWTYTGEQAIPNAEKGEVEYYKNVGIKYRKEPAFPFVGGRDFRGRKDGRWGLNNAVLWIEGIKEGPLDPLERPGFRIQNGAMKVQGPGGEAVLFCALRDKVYAFTYDSFPYEIAIRDLASGKEVSSGTVSAFDKSTIKPLGGGGLHYTKVPEQFQSEVFMKTGLHELYCKRHKWLKGWVAVVDSPYVSVSHNHYDGDKVGLFELKGVPVGKHTLHVWHPVYPAKEKTIEVEVKQNETAELLVEFQAPQ